MVDREKVIRDLSTALVQMRDFSRYTPEDVDELEKAGWQALKYLESEEEIVRCKDCKHLFDGEHTKNCCDVLMEKTGWLKEISVSPDWFCADGERR